MPRLREQRSLFGEILNWMLAPLLVLWPMSVGLTWLVAQGVANQPFDRELAAKVRLLGREFAAQAETGRGLAGFVLPPRGAEALRPDEEDDTRFQVRGAGGEVLSGAGLLATATDEEHAAPGEVRFRDDEAGSQPVRVAYMWVPGLDSHGTGAPLVQVSEKLGKRNRLATEIVKGVILPLAVLLIWLALARGLEPLHAVQQRIRRRSSGDLSPIDERHIPEEIAPLVRAINHLLARLDESVRAQKHFLADAAHQLKTPLAGLRIQAELAGRAIEAGQHDPAALRESLLQIARSSQNAAHMVNQLFAMARAEHEEDAARQGSVNLAMTARNAVRDFVPRALDKQIDLGFEGPADACAGSAPGGTCILGSAVLLRELVRNLVDNALLYTPQHGAVTVRVLDDPFGQAVVLQVEDSGPGITAAEREQVFRPFYRSLGTNVDGSGLGLAIVREIAVRHGAEVTLGDADERRRDVPARAGEPGPGALFTVRFPAAPAPSQESGTTMTTETPAERARPVSGFA